MMIVIVKSGIFGLEKKTNLFLLNKLVGMYLWMILYMQIYKLIGMYLIIISIFANLKTVVR